MNIKAPKIFYGWWIIGAVFCSSAYTSGIITFGFTAVFNPLVDEFGWSHSQVAMIMTIRGMEMGILAPIVGVLLDRHGPRKLLFLGGVITGCGLLLFSRIQTLLSFYGAFLLIAAGISTQVGVLPMTLATNWFHRNASTATGIVVSGAACGGILVPFVTWLIDSFEWRGAMVVLGFTSWIIILPLSLIVRYKPEQYGLLPDGDTDPIIPENIQLNHNVYEERRISVRQALKSSSFWLISFGLASHVFSIHAVITHVMPYLNIIGLSRSKASFIASTIILISISGRLGFGWLGDRFDKRIVMTVGVALTGLGTLLFGAVAKEGTLLILPFVIIFSIGYGGPIAVFPALLHEQFGSSKFSSILGIAQGVIMLGSITGPPLAGWIFDLYGVYHGAWFAFSVITIIGSFSFLFITPPCNEAVKI